MSEVKRKMLTEAVELPIIMAPMFLISNPTMVIQACAAGIIGTFPALNARTTDILEDWLKEIDREIQQMEKKNSATRVAPWGINLIVHRSNKRYLEDLQLIEKYQPPIVITSLGDPGPAAEIVHAYGGTVFSDVINITFAKKAIEKEADGLILVAAGAGGHGGTYNPISFVHEVRTFFDGPIALAGGMSLGEDVLAAELLGADFAYMGTRFIPAVESSAQSAYKEMILQASVDDILYTDAFTGVSANYLQPSIVKAGLHPAKLTKKASVDFSELQRKDVKAWRDIWGAGQGVGAIHEVKSIAEIVNELKAGYDKAAQFVMKKASKKG